MGLRLRGIHSVCGHMQLRLLTLNCWGLKYVSKLRTERLQAIADRLANPRDDADVFDIVALQEVWCEQDWRYIDLVCSHQYPYRRIFKSGIISGPGLAVLLKIPIESTFLYRFPINGRSLAFWRGDWYVGKGVAVTILSPRNPKGLPQSPPPRPIALLNSHMHAPYGNHTGDAGYGCHRACQAWDFAKLVRVLTRAGYAVVQVGDLNLKPGSLPYKLFTIEGGLVDLWDQRQLATPAPPLTELVSDAARPSTAISLGYGSILRSGLVVQQPLMATTATALHAQSNHNDLALLSPLDQIRIGGATCDLTLNTWREFKQPHQACRLDYALVNPQCISTTDAKVVFTERLPEPHNCLYLDHFAYSANFHILAAGEQHSTTEASTNSNVVDRVAVYKEMLLVLHDYQKYTIPWQARWRKYHFFVGIAFVALMHAAMPVAASLRPLVALTVLVLLTLVGISSVLNGLIWGFGVRSESRALQEVRMEVEDMLRTLTEE